jgi:hypothetical protein
MSLGRKKRPLHRGRASRWVAAEERGAELVEFAVVLPTLLMLLIGIIWPGRAFNICETIIWYGAAPNCALCAIKNTLPDCTSQVKPVVDAAVKAAGLAANEKNFSCQNGVTLVPGADPPETGVVISFGIPVRLVQPGN